MKCIIFSDSHGNTSYMDRVLYMHRDADHVFFLGDGLSDFELVMQYHRIPFTAVCGNCDFRKTLFGKEVPRLTMVELFNKKILLTHGHMFAVKEGTSLLTSHAKELGADIVIYGHTHIPSEEYLTDEKMYLFNPGSIGCNENTFGILTLDETPLFSHGSFRRK